MGRETDDSAGQEKDMMSLDLDSARDDDDINRLREKSCCESSHHHFSSMVSLVINFSVSAVCDAE